MKIGLIGCGNMGKEIIKASSSGLFKSGIYAVFDVDRKGFDSTDADIRKGTAFYSDFGDFLSADTDFVVEVASIDAVKLYAEKVLNAKKHLMIMSVGALADRNLYDRIEKTAEKMNVEVYVPSGAICGIDGLNAAVMGRIESVELVTRKNPKSLGMGTMMEEKVVFEGNSKNAVSEFPKNINVSATLGLAGVGPEKTRVKIIADPKVKSNIHEVYMKGDFGEIRITAKNLPSPENPRTSYLAILSAIATIKKIEGRIRIGT